jgi:hypothetical protein
VRWSLEKYSEESILSLGTDKLDLNRIVAELTRYVDIMKKAFYIQ